MTHLSRPRAVSARPRAGKAPSATGLDSVSDPVDLARLTLQMICRDENSPASARAQAARTLLELAGALKNGSQNSIKSQSEMSLSEIEARLADLTDPV